MHDCRCYLHYGKVTSETARKLQVTFEKRASLSVGQRASGRREVHIPILPRPLCRGGEECWPSGEVSPAESRATASIRTDGPSRTSVRDWLT